MRKFSVCSGFLGSGKTTVMLAVANYLEKSGRKTALICNDLGKDNLVDGLYTAENCRCSCTIAGGCICYCTEKLADTVRHFTDAEGASLVISDIPGCGVGALDHVYFKLSREYPGEFTLAPFTVVCDPLRLKAIMPGERTLKLPTEMDYLFRTQLLEADAIVFNKTDTVSPEERAACEAFLRKTYPGIPVFSTCALSGEGVAALAEHLFTATARLVAVETGYGGADFMAAEEKLSWYDCRMEVASGSVMDGNAFALTFAEVAARLFKEAERNVPHLKVFGMGADNDYLKLSVIDAYVPARFDRRALKENNTFRFWINARAACESKKLDEIMTLAREETARAFNAETAVQDTEFFGMTDPD